LYYKYYLGKCAKTNERVKELLILSANEGVNMAKRDLAYIYENEGEFIKAAQLYLETESKNNFKEMIEKILKPNYCDSKDLKLLYEIVISKEINEIYDNKLPSIIQLLRTQITN